MIQKINILSMRSSIVLMTILLLGGCSFFTSYGRYWVRAEKAAKSGDYDSAVEYCVASLSENPSYKNSIRLLDTVFPKSIHYHHMKINRLTASGDEFAWDRIVKEYGALSTLVDLLESLELPQTEVLLFRSDVKNYQTLLSEAKIHAAEEHYEAGIRSMNEDDREGFKMAADHFKTAMSYVNHFKDSAALYEVCRQNAITRIAIMAFDNSSGVNRFGSVGEQVSNQLLTSLMNDPEVMEFVEFVTRDKIDMILDEQQLAGSGLVSEDNSVEIGNILGVHETITGSITHVSATEPQHIKDRQRLEKKVVAGSETYIDDDGKEHERNVYQFVHANVTFHKIQAGAMVNISYKLMDVNTAKILYSNNLPGSYTYEYEWVTYSGDVRALTFFARLLTGHKEQPTPSREELVQRAIEKLTGKLVSDIKNTLK